MIKSVMSEGNLVTVISDKGEVAVHFQAKVADVLKFEDSIIVRTVAISKERARNIHRYSEDGTKMWTVEESEGVKGLANAFIGMQMNKKGELIAATWQGLTHKIDFQTGKILSSLFTK